MATPEQRSDEALGLERGIVRLRDHNPRWAELFAAESASIRTAMGALALDVQHVGSTAIPGIKAKPILDIAVAVRTLEDLPLFQAALIPIGYEYAHWAGLDNNLVFGKGLVRTHLVHIVSLDGERWRNYMRFKSALLLDRALALRYEQVKLALAASNSSDRAAYTAAKNEFISHVLSAA